MIDWSKAGEKVSSVQWLYKNVPGIKKGIDRECTIVLEPVPTPGPNPIPEPILGPAKTKLSDYVKPVSEEQLLQLLPAVYAVAPVNSPNLPWRWAGNQHYQWLNTTYLSILAIIVKDYDLIMGDATGARGGNHVYHEGKYYTFDLDYPTKSGKGTHYGRMKYGFGLIWKDVEHQIIDFDEFDKAKTIEVLSKIKAVFPYAVIRVNDKMKSILGLSWIQSDNNPVMFHWLHIHIDLGMSVNWGYEV